MRCGFPFLLCALLWSGETLSASFDCQKAKTPVEKLICGDPTLSVLDDGLAFAYRQQLASSGQRDALKAQQQAWLRERNACRDRACLKAAYSKRLAELQPASPSPVAEGQEEGMAPDFMRGLLTAQASISEARAKHDCLALPVAPPEDRLQGPHGDSLISTRCEVVAYQVLTDAPSTRWAAARYSWTSVFTAEDKARGPDARDTATEEEVVLFDISQHGQARPVWHARFETGGYAVWASITPEVARTADATTLLSVMTCVNGTGGCGQDFLHRHADGRWFPVRQTWLDQLPHGFVGQILHGVRIDPLTLRGEAGFYGDRDANCCPSQRLIVDLALRGDSLVLRHEEVVREPN